MGCGISVTIEALQFFFMRDFSEVDDVIHNTLGCLIGYILVKGSWLVALLIGCSISVTVEALQFFFMRGFSEVDDVMHNTVGCLIGYILVQGLRFKV